MTTLTNAEARPVAPRRSRAAWAGWVLLVLALAWAWNGAEMNPAMLWRDGGNMREFLGDFFPPDFRYWQRYLSEMLVTIQIAIWGTALAIVCSIPLGILCSENIAPWWICQ